MISRLCLAILVMGAAAYCVALASAQPPAASAAPANSVAAPQPVAAASPVKVDPVLPLVSLAIGIAIVLGLIIGLKMNAFIALITAAMVVSMLAPGALGDKMSRVAVAFGASAGGIGIVIALAAVIGKCMLDSGAADRIVRAFVNLLGEKHAPTALMGSGFLLSVPVFFDTVFYLLVPLARSLYKRTGRNYLLYILAICAGGATTHTLVPPTPGPLVMANTLKIDVGMMMLIGGLVGIPAALAGLGYSILANRLMPIPMRQVGNAPETPALKDEELPSLWESLVPVLLPVVLITANTVVDTIAKNAIKPQLAAAGIATPNKEQLTAAIRDLDKITDPTARQWAVRAGYASFFGDANFALLVSTAVAAWTLVRQRKLNSTQMAEVVEESLMSAGVIILITAGGGAFGKMLDAAQVGHAIQQLFPTQGNGMMVLLLGFFIAALLKIAQGSSTVAMITGSAMLASLAEPAVLGFHPVYLATAIGGGSLIGSWMNDSGFWIFAKMGGLTELEALKTWTVLLFILGLTSFITTLILSQVLPLV